MPVRAEPFDVREKALDYAKTLFPEDKKPEPERLLAVAAEVAEFWTTPTVIRIRVGLIRHQDGTDRQHEWKDDKMQLRDNEEVEYTVVALDAKGYQVQGEAFQCSSSDQNVVTVEQEGGNFTAVAGVPGSAVLTFTDGTLTATEAIDVVPAEAATIQIQAGEVHDQEPTA